MSDLNEALHVYEIDDGALTLVIANSEEDAMYLLAVETYGERDVDSWRESAEVEIVQWPDEANLALNNEEIDGGTAAEQKTCREWTRQGRGVLGGTEW